MRSFLLGVAISIARAAEFDKGVFQYTGGTTPVIDESITTTTPVSCGGEFNFGGSRWTGSPKGLNYVPLYTVLWERRTTPLDGPHEMCGQLMRVQEKDQRSYYAVVAATIIDHIGGDEPLVERGIFLHENDIEICEGGECVFTDIEKTDDHLPVNTILEIRNNFGLCDHVAGENVLGAQLVDLDSKWGEEGGSTPPPEYCGMRVEITNSLGEKYVEEIVTTRRFTPSGVFGVDITSDACRTICHTDNENDCKGGHGRKQHVPLSCGNPTFVILEAETTTTTKAATTPGEGEDATTDSAEWAMLGIASLLALV